MRSFTIRSLLLFLFLALSVPALAESTRFSVVGETVTDNQSHLMWQKGDSYHDLQKGLTWYQALEYVDQKNLEQFGGHNDWRLPKMAELAGLWDSSRPLLSKDREPIGLPGMFTGGGSYYLWSGNERNLDNAWYFGLGQKEDYFNLKELGDLDQGVKMVRETK